MKQGWSHALSAAVLLALCGLLLGGCPQRGGRGIAMQQPPSALGFADFAVTSQLDPWWTQMGGPRNIRSAWLSADSNSLLLELRRAVQIADEDGTAQDANAVLLERNPLPRHSPLVLEGRLLNVDFTARQVTLELRDAAGGVIQMTRGFDGSDAAFHPPQEPDESEGGQGALRAADSRGAGEWACYPPVGGGSGTGREASAAQGGVLRFHQAGAEPLGFGLGSLPFTQLAGSHAARRAVLISPGAGVLLVDYRLEDDPQLSWLLRDSGDSGLYLQPEADALLCINADGIRLIGLGELSELASRLSAGQQLSATHTRRIKPATEALGWSWSAVQLSPLAAVPGRLSLFDTADLHSATAELEWDAAAGRATRLLIAREPREADDALRTSTAETQEKTVSALLALLGWPQARAVEVLDNGGQDQDAGTDEATPAVDSAQPDAVLRWQLADDPAAGSFSLWLTPEAAVWELRTAD